MAFEVVTIPPGTIDIDGNTHAIDPLAVSVTEVTWDLYDVYLFALDVPESGGESDAVSRPSKPYVPPDRGYGHAGYPAMGMTRHAAVEFCAWLSEKTGDKYRLPTRAEWIYLSEASNPLDRHDDRSGSGETVVATAASAWTEENADYTTHPVGKKTPNAWGIRDTLGNVAEWVAPKPGQRPKDGPLAMGGSFLDPSARCTSRDETLQEPFWNASDPQIPKSVWWLADCDFVGFRVVRETGDADSTSGTKEGER